jgi:hypothetical protein
LQDEIAAGKVQPIKHFNSFVLCQTGERWYPWFEHLDAAQRPVSPALSRGLHTRGPGCADATDEAKNWGLVHWARAILNVLFDGNADTTCYQVDQILASSHYRFDIPLGESPKQDANAVNEDFDDASPDNIARIERKADALIRGMAGKLQTVIDELRTPKWNPATT